jgi:hypothetical protein
MPENLLSYLPQVTAILLAATRMIPRLGPLWSRVLPPKWQWVPGVAVLALPQIADSLGLVKSPLDLVETVTLAIALMVPGARSSAHVALAKDAAPPTPKTGAGAAPLALLLLAGTIAVSPGLTSCSPSASPEASGAQAMDVTRAAFNVAAVSVKALDEVNAAWINAVANTGDAALANAALEPARKITAAVNAARDELAKARAELEGGSEAKARAYLVDAIGYADAALMVLDMAGQGGRVPKEVKDALAFLRGFVSRSAAGGAS